MPITNTDDKKNPANATWLTRSWARSCKYRAAILCNASVMFTYLKSVEIGCCIQLFAARILTMESVAPKAIKNVTIKWARPLNLSQLKKKQTKHGCFQHKCSNPFNCQNR